ncbi:MATE family efflux transporter [Kordiimonas sediminis]|uniref:Multidrug-efflux transporter n=1 Tax=Kordiimonas sediminis TaxID=1735581 RepID=A0A919AKN5_9PROT|nr:MATE family efflux transporter [Kordiimonas sediminis]GHF12151.1 MATE family efflux transporter [Kordiimonas sediminis]
MQWTKEENLSPRWLAERLTRHFSELVRLAAPAVMMRIGIVTIGMVDTALVGHYATKHLAWLNLANQSVIMFALVVGLGLMSSILVYAANAFGADDFEECGRVWRRSLPFAILFGVGAMIIVWPTEFWLTLLGQPEENVREGGRLIRIMALGLPGHMLFIACTMFLEGVKRTDIGFYVMIGANIVNLILDYTLIYGHFGFTEMGAAGAAWASTGVRWFMALAAMAYVWWAPSLRQFHVRNPHGQKWRDWKDQRMMGYAAAVSLAAEVLAFGALAVFAGWLGTVTLAGHGVVYQVLGIPLMIAIGIGVASSVRVGITFSRRDRWDTILAAMSGTVLNLLIAGLFAVIIYLFMEPVLGIFTDDERVIALLVPLATIVTIGMVFDSAQMVISSSLRGLRETWWPTALQAFSFGIVMLPVCYILAITLEWGMTGLMTGMLVGTAVSWVLQMWRFWWLVR